MSEQLTARNEIIIDEAPAKVWEVLISPRYIRQWDDLPEGFGEEPLALGTVIDWTGYARMAVAEFEPEKKLRQSLYSPKWEHQSEAYDIGYTYLLTPLDGGRRTLLHIAIGDFAQLPDGQPYYEDSVRFGSEAAEKIKGLAERIVEL